MVQMGSADIKTLTILDIRQINFSVERLVPNIGTGRSIIFDS
jgi:hypothetical protein